MIIMVTSMTSSTMMVRTTTSMMVIMTRRREECHCPFPEKLLLHNCCSRKTVSVAISFVLFFCRILFLFLETAPSRANQSLKPLCLEEGSDFQDKECERD